MLLRYTRFSARLLSLFLPAFAPALEPDPTLDHVIKTPILTNALYASHNAVLEHVQVADILSDFILSSCDTRDGLYAHQLDLRVHWIASFGGFPERTPLNPLFDTPIQRTGYTITKVRFESQPGLFVTAHLFKPAERSTKPRPCILIPCGHSAEGKAADIYQRAALMCAQAGFITLIYDPIDQGERWQLPGPKPPISTSGHNITGTSAMLLGWNTARFRIWDGMRALDLLTSLPDVDPTRIGVLGNSGGGTLTAYLMNLDKRVTTAIPSCFFTTIRALCASIGPQDAEQNFFGQLAFRLNHAALLTLRAPEFPVCVSATYDDFFPFEGTQSTLGTAHDIYTVTGARHADFKTLRCDSSLGLIDMPGPHGWKEGSLIASTHWLRAKLYNDTTAFPLDLEPLRANATNFNLKAVDCGLDPVAARVTPTGQVRDLPGNRTVYDLMRDELARCPKPVFTDPQEKKAIVQRCLGIDDATIPPLTAQLVSQIDHDQWTAFRYALTPMQGTLTNAIPALLVVPKTITAAPRMVLSDCGKTNTVDLIQHGLQAGSPVLAIDLFATGEVGALKHPFYGSKRADEGISVMLYLLGRSMVEVRTREIVACTAWLAERYQKPVQIITRGSAAIPAYHAYALLPERIQSITTETPPLAWREVVQKSDKYAFANCVHKALRSYDWVDLYK